MSNPIPDASRRIVERRDRGRCVRCGGVGTDWHHRRGRSVKDQHQHCACNGILLCRTCHSYVHHYPSIAAGMGFVVSRHEPWPESTPVKSVQGWAILSCEGDATWTPESEIEIVDGVPQIVDL